MFSSRLITLIFAMLACAFFVSSGPAVEQRDLIEARHAAAEALAIELRDMSSCNPNPCAVNGSNEQPILDILTVLQKDISGLLSHLNSSTDPNTIVPGTVNLVKVAILKIRAIQVCTSPGALIDSVAQVLSDTINNVAKIPLTYNLLKMIPVSLALDPVLSELVKSTKIDIPSLTKALSPKINTGLLGSALLPMTKLALGV